VKTSQIIGSRKMIILYSDW